MSIYEYSVCQGCLDEFGRPFVLHAGLSMLLDFVFVFVNKRLKELSGLAC